MQEEEKRGERNLQSLQKDSKIKKTSEFKEIFRTGKRVSGKGLTIIFIEGSGFRFGITFKREAKSAVKRNRIKRRLTEIIRMKKELLKKNIHMVIHISKNGFDLSFNELLTELIHLLKVGRIIE